MGFYLLPHYNSVHAWPTNFVVWPTKLGSDWPLWPAAWKNYLFYSWFCSGWLTKYRTLHGTNSVMLHSQSQHLTKGLSTRQILRLHKQLQQTSIGSSHTLPPLPPSQDLLPTEMKINRQAAWKIVESHLCNSGFWGFVSFMSRMSTWLSSRWDESFSSQSSMWCAILMRSLSTPPWSQSNSLFKWSRALAERDDTQAIQERNVWEELLKRSRGLQSTVLCSGEVVTDCDGGSVTTKRRVTT